ncbi:MAG: hypothetical protein HQL48_09930 [Gammaproteobacteria bacterium]|nr:hypothetical protein [Gammaproteobacteria bacterium]
MPAIRKEREYIALEDVSCYPIEREAFLDMLNSNPGANLRFHYYPH